MSASGCPRGDEVDAALDARLAPDHCRDVIAHAHRCAPCGERLASRAARVELLRALPDGAPDELSARRLRARLVASALRRDGTRRVPVGVVALAAMVLVALAMSLRPWGFGEIPVEPGEHRLGRAGALRPQPGARWSVRDEAGDTRVSLDDGSILLRVRPRRRGERFRVLLRDAEVEVRGTRFEVVARGGSLRAVRVDEGLVAVRRRGDAEQLLAAGSRYAAPEPVIEPVAPQGPVIVTRVTEPPPAPVPAPAPRRSPDVGRDFQDGALAHSRGDHATAAARLGRFLSASAARDPRREDARYLRVLSLRAAGRDAEAAAEAARYLEEFPNGLRRVEVSRAAASIARESRR